MINPSVPPPGEIARVSDLTNAGAQFAAALGSAARRHLCNPEVIVLHDDIARLAPSIDRTPTGVPLSRRHRAVS